MCAFFKALELRKVLDQVFRGGYAIRGKGGGGGGDKGLKLL